MGPVVELRVADFDLLGLAEPVHRQIAASEPLWPAFDVKLCVNGHFVSWSPSLWQASNLDT